VAELVDIDSDPQRSLK